MIFRGDELRRPVSGTHEEQSVPRGRVDGCSATTAAQHALFPAPAPRAGAHLQTSGASDHVTTSV